MACISCGSEIMRDETIRDGGVDFPVKVCENQKCSWWG